MTIPGEADLVAAAIEAARSAYAPYSGFLVGAAVALCDGRFATGANVENASFGLSICAEANAITTLIGAGHGTIARMAVVGWPKRAQATRTLATPCGRCRQIIVEFAAPTTTVVVAYPDGEIALRLAPHELLPHAFRTGTLD